MTCPTPDHVVEYRMSIRILYDIAAAAAAVSQSEATIRRAIHCIDPRAFPAPLEAKKAGKKYVITHAALVRWADSLEDA